MFAHFPQFKGTEGYSMKTKQYFKKNQSFNTWAKICTYWIQNNVWSIILPLQKNSLFSKLPLLSPNHMVTVRTTSFTCDPGPWPLADLAVDTRSKLGQWVFFLRNLKLRLRNCILSLVSLLNWVAAGSSYFLPSGRRREYGDRKQFSVGQRQEKKGNYLVSTVLSPEVRLPPMASSITALESLTCSLHLTNNTPYLLFRLFK